MTPIIYINPMPESSVECRCYDGCYCLAGEPYDNCEIPDIGKCTRLKPLVLCGECKWIYYDIAEKSYWCTKCRYTPRWQQTDPTHFCKDGVKA